jgi:hypothetical protein
MLLATVVWATPRRFASSLSVALFVLVKPQRDLLGTRGSNLEVKVLEFIRELFDVVTIPEITLRAIAFETRKLALFFIRGLSPLALAIMEFFEFSRASIFLARPATPLLPPPAAPTLPP